MPKRKRVVIKASEWGPSQLLNTERGTKCCMGFACLATGKTEKQIAGYGMPETLGVRLFLPAPSAKLIRLYKEHASKINDRFGTHNIQGIVADINDAYHGNLITLQMALPILRQGFREAGLTLVYRADL